MLLSLEDSESLGRGYLLHPKHTKSYKTYAEEKTCQRNALMLCRWLFLRQISTSKFRNKSLLRILWVIVYCSTLQCGSVTVMMSSALTSSVRTVCPVRACLALTANFVMSPLMRCGRNQVTMTNVWF